MKKLYRSAVIILSLSASLSLASILRGASPSNYGFESSIMPLRTLMWNFEAPPRNIRLEVNMNKEVNVSLFAPSKEDGKQSLIFYAEHVKQEVYKISLPKRGEYHVLVQNPSLFTINGSVRITAYGFEKDVLQASINLSILGFIIALLQYAILRVKQDHS